MIIYGNSVLLCTVHESKSQRDVQIYAVSLLPSVTIQDIVPPRRKKNEHTPHNLRGKCPMIVPVFCYSHGIDLSTLNVVRLIHRGDPVFCARGSKVKGQKLLSDWRKWVCRIWHHWLKCSTQIYTQTTWHSSDHDLVARWGCSCGCETCCCLVQREELLTVPVTEV